MQLAEIGATIVCVDNNQDTNNITVRDIHTRGGNAYGYVCDVTKHEDVERLLRDIEKIIGDISMLFHCCGVPSPRSLVNEAPPIQTTFDVCIVSHFLVSIFIELLISDYLNKNNFF